MKSLTTCLSLVLATLLLGAGAVGAAEETLVIDGSTTVGPIAKAFAEHYMASHKGVNVTVSESGSGNGAKSLINGVCHVADMSRFMKDKEFAAAVEKGVHPVFHVVALDGLPVLVHPANPINELTLEQVRDIFAGKITRWSQVGGPDKKIVVITRDTNSGTYETFHKIVMGGARITEDAEYVASNGQMRGRVQKTPTAIGYAGLGFVDRTVKALKINGVAPSKGTVVSGVYPIARPLFMVTNGVPKLGTHLYRFVTLHLTRKGQEIVEAIGFVPVTSY